MLHNLSEDTNDKAESVLESPALNPSAIFPDKGHLQTKKWEKKGAVFCRKDG